jgi:sortase B
MNQKSETKFNPVSKIVNGSVKTLNTGFIGFKKNKKSLESKEKNAFFGSGVSLNAFDFIDDSAAISVNEFIENPLNNSEASPFIHSLDTLTADDIALPKQKSKMTSSDLMYNALRYILLIISVGVFIYSLVNIIHRLWSYKRTDDIYNSFSETFMNLNTDTEYAAFDGNYDYSGLLMLSPTLSKSAATPDYNASYDSSAENLITDNKVEVRKYDKRVESVKSSINTITNKYPDTYAYIKIENTKIDYPVMQAADNDFYLNRAATGDYLVSGAIFADFRCYRDLTKNFNTILYGHNMNNGSMFSSLPRFLDAKYFEENKYIELYTVDGIYTYEIFSIHKAKYDDNYIQTSFSSYEEFIAFAENLEAVSINRRSEDIEFTANDHILTLSTCTNVARNDRYALHARLIKVEN